jgi:hypothetical protein
MKFKTVREEKYWAMFAAAFLSSNHFVSGDVFSARSAKVADETLTEMRKRYPKEELEE